MKENRRLEDKPVLSISLLSSNRKKTIRKCLDSLKPIMEQISSELIIVDTGCDEETHKLLLEYTDQVIPFEWCNDFSKARNAGLELARGEWFMFIDDDEWFSDVAEIVDFFQSGEYRSYGIACYIQRNYSDYAETHYHDDWVSRLIRLDEDTRFVSSIHEYLFPVKGECKLLHAPAKHFGYIFSNNQEKYEHSKRNVSLLEEMIKKERGRLRWWVQLAQEYQGIREFRKMEELCTEAIRMIEKQDQYAVNKERGAFYSGKIMAELKTYRYEEAEKAYHESIKDKRNTSLCQARLYAYGAEIYFHKQEYTLCEECCKHYLRIYESLHEKEWEIFKQGAFFVSDTLEEGVRNSIYSWLMVSALKKQDSRILKEYFGKIDWQAKSLTLNTALVPAIIDAMGQFAYQEEFVGMASVMMNRKGVDKVILDILTEKEKEKENEFKKLCRIFAQIDNSHYYIWYMKVRNMDYQYKEGNAILQKEEMEKLQFYYKELFRCVVDIFSFSDKVWEIAEQYGISLEPIFLNIQFRQWKRGVDAFCEKTSLEAIEARCRLIGKVKRQENPRYEYFGLKAVEAKLVYGKGRGNYEELKSMLEEFVTGNLNFYGQYFTPKAFEEEMVLLPSSAHLAVLLDKAFGKQEYGDWKAVMSILKESIGVFPSFDHVIKEYAKLYGQKVKELEEEVKPDVLELLDTMGEALEQLQREEDSALRLDFEEGRRQVELVLNRRFSCSLEDRINTGDMSDEDWLLNMYRVLEGEENPIQIQNEYDKEFVDLLHYLWENSRERLLSEMKATLQQYETHNPGMMKSLQDYMERFPLWGSFHPEAGDWNTMELRAKVLKQKSYEFLWLYRRLGDCLSKRTLTAILRNWAVLDLKYPGVVKSIYRDYYEPDIFQNNIGDVMIDVGAFIGDSIMDYIRTYGSGYQKIYAYEISSDSYQRLCENVKNLHDVVPIRKGAGAKKDVMYLKEESCASANKLQTAGIAEDRVEVAALDDEITGKVSFIKMDIEGAEQEALLGCQNIIRNWKPKLAICLYHGYEDIWKIPFMIDSMNPDYEFYLRHYGGNYPPTEFVLLCRNKNNA